jgi:DNA-binding winged helix-turn-helix (wHTH) protein/Flp pilus assembly protein TadD
MDLASLSLFRGEKPVLLTPKALDVLRILAQAEGSVVTKEALLTQVWAGTFVEESSITKNISELRGALGESESGAPYIETFPRRGYRLCVPVRQVEESLPGKKSIAVLPFRLLETETAADGLGLRVADAVITRLITARGFVVRPTESVVRYQSQVDGRGNAGRDLEVDYLLEGAIQRCDGIIRATIQLLEVDNGTPVWGDTLETESHHIHILEAESSLAEQISGALIMFMSAEQHELLSMRYTENSHAYQLYLRGRFHWNRRSEEGLKAAIQYFRKTIGLDPEYALAHSGLAISYAMLPMLRSGRARAWMPRARVAALKALHLDDTLAEAHTTLAFVKWHYDFDWQYAEREIRRALRFQPDNATIHQWYALLLAEMGRNAEGIAEIVKARSLAPAAANICANQGEVLYLAQRYAESVAAARESMALDPHSLRAHEVLGACFQQSGEIDAAIAAFEDGLRLAPGSSMLTGMLGQAYALAGRKSAARCLLTTLQTRRRKHYYFEESMIELGLGDTAAALASLERSYEERQFWLVLLRADPRFAPLHDEPGFRSILARIGLP